MSVRKTTIGYLFSAPAIILMIVILIVPVLIAGYLSLTDYALGNAQINWIGLKNYDNLFNRSSYQKMLSASFIYVGVTAPLSIGLGLGAALLINSLTRFQDIYKAIYFLPVMAALLAMAIVWEFALHPTIGIVNKSLTAGCGSWLEEIEWYARGCSSGFPHWLGDKSFTMATICFIGVWQGFGFNMVLYLAGLTGVPRELYHAAEIDGAATAWDRFRLVTWPMLGPTTVFVVTITMIRSFQVFDTVEALTQGGPSRSTYVMMYGIFEKGIQQNLIGIGSAITIVFLAFVLALTLVQRWLVERRMHYT
ncbi:MAG: carbohydrate ABC transporter permease [Alphaproteobacteria bacterium]